MYAEQKRYKKWVANRAIYGTQQTKYAQCSIIRFYSWISVCSDAAQVSRMAVAVTTAEACEVYTRPAMRCCSQVDRFQTHTATSSRIASSGSKGGFETCLIKSLSYVYDLACTRRIGSSGLWVNVYLTLGSDVHVLADTQISEAPVYDLLCTLGIRAYSPLHPIRVIAFIHRVRHRIIAFVHSFSSTLLYVAFFRSHRASRPVIRPIFVFSFDLRLCRAFKIRSSLYRSGTVWSWTLFGQLQVWHTLLSSISPGKRQTHQSYSSYRDDADRTWKHEQVPWVKLSWTWVDKLVYTGQPTQ